MSVEASLKGFRFLVWVSGSNRNWERETMNRLREKYMNKTFRIRFGFSCSDNRKSKTCTELGRRIQNAEMAGGLLRILVLHCWNVW